MPVTDEAVKDLKSGDRVLSMYASVSQTVDGLSDQASIWRVLRVEDLFTLCAVHKSVCAV